MSTNFPGSVDDGTTLPNPGANAPTNNPSLSAGQTNQNDAIKAVEAKVGTGASTPTAGKVFRGTGTGTSAWGALDVTTDLTGTLPVANGGTGLTVLTIPASAILVGTTDAQDLTNKTLHDTFMGTTFMSQSATFRNVLLDASVNYLVTELVEVGAAFTLEVPATSTLEVRPFHGPQSFSSAQHDHTTAAGGGQLPFGALTSTIFSGQIQTYTNSGSAGGTIKWINLGGLKIIWGFNVTTNTGAWLVVDLLPVGLASAPAVVCTGMTQGTSPVGPSGWLEVTSKSSPAGGSPEAGGFSLLARVSTAANENPNVNFIAIGT